jgi:hypothetical protein
LAALEIVDHRQPHRVILVLEGPVIIL